MPKLTLHTSDTAPVGSRDALGGLEEKFGFAPNLLRQMAEAPTAIGGALQLMGLLDNSSLTPSERWVTLLVTAAQNSSNYCMAANSTMAIMMGVPNDIIQTVRHEQSFSDDKLEALRIFVTEIVQQRGMISPEVTQRLLDAGYSKAQIFDVILAIGLETIASLSAHVADTPVDIQFQSNAWSNQKTAKQANA